MSQILAPHFDIPFRLGRAGAAVVEQSSIDDIANCVTVIFMTHVGWRDEVPSFGIRDLAFSRQPISEVEIINIIGSQERRAALIVDEQPDRADELIDRINVGVGLLQRGIE
jgi:hypothetical protein